MPTYEYRCPAGHDFEKFYRKISDAGAEVPCPKCGEVASRLISAGAGLVFKGSGFYITDYGKDGKKDQRTAGASKSSADGGGAESTAPAASTPGGDKPSTEAKPASDAKPAAATKESKSAPAPAPKPGKSSSE